MPARPVLLGACIAIVAGSAQAAIDEFKVKRQAVYEFTDRPSLARDGDPSTNSRRAPSTGSGRDKVTIRFASKAFCDATVAIEDANGRIVRHLASGVLGPNAPEPFQKNSLAQAVVWDGKDDKGEYVQNRDKVAIRVSLGLKPAFEKALFWEPKRRITPRPPVSWGRTGLTAGLPSPPLMQATEEGVFVYDGGWVDHLRLFDHDGNYVRTVYPFPADKLDKVGGLSWRTAPQDGRRVVAKQGETESTLLTSGDNLRAHGGAGDGVWGNAAKAMAVRGGRIALCDLSLNRLATDGSSGGLQLQGPATSFVATKGRESVKVCPRSAAISPDGKTLYLACYGYQVQGGFDVFYRYLPAVFRMDFEGDGEPRVFAGGATEGETGSDDAHLAVPSSVACDAKGRVYVSDCMNDRVQVFDPGGKLLKSIKAAKPAQVLVHQRTGDIYVASWMFHSDLLAAANDRAKAAQSKLAIQATLSHFGPLDDPQLRSSCPLPLENYVEEFVSHSSLGGWQYRLELDSWTDPPTFWLAPGAPPPWDKAGIRLLVEKDGRLEVKRDFAQDALRSVGRCSRPAHLRSYLFVNPRDGRLYVGERDAGGLAPASTELVGIDPDSGRAASIRLPLAAYDIAFDLDGRACVRFQDVIARFDPQTWREVPWDYGEERKNVGIGGARADLMSAIVSPGCRGVYSAVGGMSVSARGNLALYAYQSGSIDADRFKRKDMWALRDEAGSFTAEGGRTFKPRLYPGRMTGQEVHVWDAHGRPLFEDAIPGIAKVEGGLGIDRENNLYVVASPNRVLDGKPYDRDSAGTWMKFKPMAGRFVCSSSAIPVPLGRADQPTRPPDVQDGSYMRSVWLEGVEAMYGGVGFFHTNRGQRCMCHDSRFALDYFARSFLPELDHYSVAVVDANGNLILRIGRYGNADDGKPLNPAGSPAKTRAIGGDEVGLFDPRYLAVHTDRRLFIADVGNARIVSVKLEYHATEKLPLKED